MTVLLEKNTLTAPVRPAMPAEVRDAWTEALRSGRYARAGVQVERDEEGRLTTRMKYASWDDVNGNNAAHLGFLGIATTGRLNRSAGEYEHPAWNETCQANELTTVNDYGLRDFAGIADLIDEGAVVGVPARA